MSKEGDVFSLRISEAFPEDEGVYKCVASNPGGQVTLSSSLSVLAPDSQEVAPTISRMADVTVLEGSPAQFRTQVTGKPTPTVQWFREGALIPSSPDFQVSLIHSALVCIVSFLECSASYCYRLQEIGQTCHIR